MTSLATPRDRILILDDNALVLRFVSEALRLKGYCVDATSSGKEALAKVRDIDYAALVTDYEMPEITGVDVISALRAEGRRIPAVLMSSHVPGELGRRLEKYDGIWQLEKPFSLDELYAAVHAAAMMRKPPENA